MPLDPLELTVDDGRGGTDADQVTVTAIAQGDADGDGRVTVIDARICLQFAQGRIPLTQAQQRSCDADGDGQVTRTDAAKIAQFSIGVISGLAITGALIGLGALFGVPTLLRIKAARRRLWGFAVLLASLMPLLTSCAGLVPALPKGVTGVTATVGAGVILVEVQAMPDGGVAALEAKAGGLTFDPRAITVTGLRPAEGWTLLASQIDNANGEIRFGLVRPANGVKDGVILSMAFEMGSRYWSRSSAVLSWDKSRLTLGDANNQRIPATAFQTGTSP